MKTFSALFRQINSAGMTIVLGIVLLFVLINFNRDLGIIYGIMLVLDYIMMKEMTVLYPFERDTNRFSDILYGMAGYAVFIIISTIIYFGINMATSFAGTAQSMFQNLAASTPILSNSKILTFVGWGILIPLVETNFFFGRMMEFLKNTFGMHGELDLFNFKTWFLWIFISATFAIFHLTARAITVTQFDNTALMMTFVFGFVSCFIVAWTKELAAASYMHVINNSIGVSVKLGIKFVGALLGIPMGQ